MAIDDDKNYTLTGAQVKDLAAKVKARAYDNDMIGASAFSSGTRGLVPTPAAGDNTKFLRGDGTWATAGGGGGGTIRKLKIYDQYMGTLLFPNHYINGQDLQIFDENGNNVYAADIIAMISRGEQIVFVTEETNLPGFVPNIGVVKSYSALISSSFDYDYPDDNDVYNFYMEVEATTVAGTKTGFVLTFYSGVTHYFATHDGFISFMVPFTSQAPFSWSVAGNDITGQYAAQAYPDGMISTFPQMTGSITGAFMLAVGEAVYSGRGIEIIMVDNNSPTYALASIRFTDFVLTDTSGFPTQHSTISSGADVAYFLENGGGGRLIATAPGMQMSGNIVMQITNGSMTFNGS